MATIDKRVASNGKVTYRARARLKGCPRMSRASRARRTPASGPHPSSLRCVRVATSNSARPSNIRWPNSSIATFRKCCRPSRITRKPAESTRWWSAQLGYASLADITPAKLAECRDRLLKAPNAKGRLRSPATVVRYLAVLSHAFTVAVKEWGWTSDNPLRRVSKPKEPRGRVRYLDDDERTRLFAACIKSKRSIALPDRPSCRFPRECAVGKSSTCAGAMLTWQRRCWFFMKRRTEKDAPSPWQGGRWRKWLA